MDQVITCCLVDTETTGLSPYRDEIIELCIILFRLNLPTGDVIEVLDEYCGLREPKVPISPGASMVHGIAGHEVQGMKLDDQKVECLIGQADLFISHNAVFDRPFLKRLYPQCSSKPWCCSMNGINWAGKGYSSKGLQNLLKAHEISVSKAHRALDDTRAVLELLCRRNEKGETYLYEMIRNSPLSAAGCAGEIAVARDDGLVQ